MDADIKIGDLYKRDIWNNVLRIKSVSRRGDIKAEVVIPPDKKYNSNNYKKGYIWTTTVNTIDVLYIKLPNHGFLNNF